MVVAEGYRIGELAEKSGLSKRTIHYYLSRGLLPPPKGAGPRSFYTEGHLLRLELLKKLQERYWPLDKIREHLNILSDEEVRRELQELQRQSCEKPDDSTASELKLLEVLETQEEFAAGGIAEYLKIDVACGISLLFPKELQEKHLKTVLHIVRYARKLLLDGGG